MDQEIRKQLLHLLRGGNAHMTFDQAVADYPLDAINRQPPHISYTPWHLLEHMRIAQWDILEFIRNPDHVSPVWPEGYWPRLEEHVDASRWVITIETFHADHKALQKLVTDPIIDLSAPIPTRKTTQYFVKFCWSPITTLTTLVNSQS